MTLEQDFKSIVDEAKLKIVSGLRVETGFMKRNFMDSFEIRRKASNGKTELSLWFDSTKFFLLVIYAIHVFNKYNFWANYPFVATSGTNPVSLAFMGITGASLTKYGMVLIVGNKLTVIKK